MGSFNRSNELDDNDMFTGAFDNVKESGQEAFSVIPKPAVTNVPKALPQTTGKTTEFETNFGDFTEAGAGAHNSGMMEPSNFSSFDADFGGDFQSVSISDNDTFFNSGNTSGTQSTTKFHIQSPGLLHTQGHNVATLSPPLVTISQGNPQLGSLPQHPISKNNVPNVENDFNAFQIAPKLQQNVDPFAASNTKPASVAPQQVGEDPFAFMNASVTQSKPVDPFAAFDTDLGSQPTDLFGGASNCDSSASSELPCSQSGKIWDNALSKGILDLSLKSPDKRSSMSGAPMRR